MRQVLTDIAKSIVNNPQSVEVEELIVDENDLGKVIGKQGRIAKAIRTVVRAVANRENKRVIVDILDHEETID